MGCLIIHCRDFRCRMVDRGERQYRNPAFRKTELRNAGNIQTRRSRQKHPGQERGRFRIRDPFLCIRLHAQPDERIRTIRTGRRNEPRFRSPVTASGWAAIHRRTSRTYKKRNQGSRSVFRRHLPEEHGNRHFGRNYRSDNH